MKKLKCCDCNSKMIYNYRNDRWECTHCITVAYASEDLSEDPDDIIWDDADVDPEQSYESVYDQMMEDNE